MYCEKCGRRIEEKMKACPHCNESVKRSFQYNEYCGGFYNLCRDLPRNKDTTQRRREVQVNPVGNNNAMAEETSRVLKDSARQWNEAKKNIQEIAKIMLGLNIATILIFGMFMGFYFVKSERDQAALKEKLAVIEQKSDNDDIALVAWQEEMTERYETLKNDVEYLKNRYKDKVTDLYKEK